MATLNSHGLEPQEEAIMDLWDEGLSVPDIAQRLGFSVARVETVTHNYADNGADLWAFQARRASVELAQAIAGAMG